MIRVVTRTYEEVTVEEFKRRVAEASCWAKLPEPKYKLFDVVIVRGSFGDHHGVISGIRCGHTKGTEYVWRYDVCVLSETVPVTVSNYSYDEGSIAPVV